MVAAANRRIIAAEKAAVPGKTSSLTDIYGDGERLFRFRMALFLNQSELGDKIGVSVNTISAYECGKINNSDRDAIRIANYMKKHMDDPASLGSPETTNILEPPPRFFPPTPGSKQEDNRIDVFLAKCRVAYLDKAASADFKLIAKECGLDTVKNLFGSIAHRLAGTRQILDGRRTPRDEAEIFKKALTEYREQQRQEQEDENVVERCKELRSIVFAQSKKMKRMETLVCSLCEELGVDPSILKEPEASAQL